MHFTSFFNFNTKGDDFKNKEQINDVNEVKKKINYLDLIFKLQHSK
jgi:hypothetical protein